MGDDYEYASGTVILDSGLTTVMHGSGLTYVKRIDSIVELEQLEKKIEETEARLKRLEEAVFGTKSGTEYLDPDRESGAV